MSTFAEGGNQTIWKDIWQFETRMFHNLRDSHPVKIFLHSIYSANRLIKKKSLESQANAGHLHVLNAVIVNVNVETFASLLF